MVYSIYNIAAAKRWQARRQRIRAASGSAKLRLLRAFGDELRALPPPAGRAPAFASVSPGDASLFTALVGAWLSLDPSNPEWPGRDRLYLTSREDLAAACAALSLCGFFPPEKLPDIASHIDASGRNASVPGLEAPGVPSGEIPQLLWESATASVRDKKRWREMFGAGGAGHGAWLAPGWRGAAETWRSCVVLDAEDGIASACRDLARRRDEPAAGLVALVKAPEISAPDLIEVWADAGWRAVLVSGGDPLQLHDVLTGAKLDAPLAVVLSIAGRMPMQLSEVVASVPRPPAAKVLARRRASELLGELPDEQFSALFDESLKLNM
jgi:transketolase